MFTIEQIHEAFSRVKSGADFPQFVQDLKAVGVSHYDYFVADGNTEYYGADNFMLKVDGKYPQMNVSNESSTDKLNRAIFIHQQGQTDYLTFCQQAANAGVEKWTTHMIEMTVAYLDKKGKILTVEPIPQP